MNKQIGALSLAFFLAASGLGLAASQPSKLSGFVGNYRGSILISAGGTSIVGTTQGAVSASKKKEKGSINLTSVISSGGSSAAWAEDYTIRTRRFAYLLNSAGTIGTGGGSAGVHKTLIKFTGAFSAGGTSFSLTATVQKNKRKLRITETLFGGSTAISVVYNLRRIGK
ncbi:MAG: hypothetical protein PHC88_09560 [Terrimicrobiaceae bacterium]|nr:hypothetical protein [Terrimicrobiaceae bacterium]